MGNAQCKSCVEGETRGPARVGSFRPNAFGLYDTAGNVAEWVEDCWNETYRGAPADGSAWTGGNCAYRVLRGGSFADKAVAVRSSARFRYDEDVHYYANGFRVARDLAAPVQEAAVASPAPPPTAAVHTPFEAALLKAASELIAKADLKNAPAKVTLVVAPFIHGATGARSNATLVGAGQVTKLIEDGYPRFAIAPFSQSSIARSPVVLIGVLNAVKGGGARGDPTVAYRICLALADIRTGKIVSKVEAQAPSEGADPQLTPFFEDSPMFSSDAAPEAFARACESAQAGEAINQVYADRILVASVVSEAIEAYDRKDYEQALRRFRQAVQIPGGNELRVLTGIYLADEALRRRTDAAEAFGDLVDFGLKRGNFALRFRFQPKAPVLISDATINAQYDLWLAVLAQRVVSSGTCIEIIDHSDKTGPRVQTGARGLMLGDAPPGEARLALSLARAQYIIKRLEAENGSLRTRLTFGVGRDNEEIDGNVEFNIFEKC
jgi:hypothetical protein